MKIWIDLANSPQVLFFQPLIAELEARGHALVITTRKYAQTTGLASRIGLSHVPIGGHAGNYNLLMACWMIVKRAVELRKHLSNEQIDLALSHNSYAQAVATRSWNIPFVTTMDYEHQPANHLSFRLARLVIVPYLFPDEQLQRFGARNVYKYAGVKEQIYLSNFSPDPGYRQRLGISEDKILVLLRPAATWTLYHRNVQNHLFGELLESLGRRKDTVVVFIPRIDEQHRAVQELGISNIWIPEKVLDGPNMICASDLVISAGGSMNREAAVLGVPAYTLFAGQRAAVDSYLIELGRMKAVSNTDQIRYEQKKKLDFSLLEAGKGLASEVADAFLSGT